MKVKRKSLIFSIIALLSTFLIGFLGWGIGSRTFEHFIKKYIVNKNYIEVKDIRPSEYCEYGFIEDYTVTNVGILYVNISLDIESILIDYSIFVVNNSFDLNVKLEYGSLFNDLQIIETSFINTECKCEYYNEILNFESKDKLNDSKNKINSVINIDNLNEDYKIIDLNFMYIFDTSSLIKETSFKEEVYDKLINKGITFKVVASI